MKRLIFTLAVLGGLSGLAAEYNVGDPVPIVLDHFGISFARDSVVDTAWVQYKGDNFYVAVCYTNRYVDPASSQIVSIDADTNYANDAAAKVYTSFSTGQSVLLSNLDVSADQLYDVDGDPRFLLVLAPVYPGKDGNADNYINDAGVFPFYGYFDPFNEDTTDTTGLSNEKDMAVIDISGSDTTIDFGALAAYYYSRYIIWSLDNEEELSLITGLAMYNAWKAGYDVINGFNGARDFGGLETQTNRSLYSYTYMYYNSPVAREQDRERLLLWMIWLEEHIPNGADFIKELATNGTRLARYQIIEHLETDLGMTPEDAFVQFGLTCALNHYNIAGYTFSSLPGDTLFSNNGSTISTVVNKDIQSFTIFVPFRKSGSAEMNIYFNGQEGNKMVVNGDTISGFRIFVLNVPNLTLTEYTSQLDSLNWTVIPNINRDYFIYVLNVNDADYSFFIGPKTPTTHTPHIIDMFTVQNPEFLKIADLYLLSEEKLYNDATMADTFPQVRLRASDEGYNSPVYTTSLMLDNDDNVISGDSVGRIYTTEFSVELKDQFGNVFSGDAFVEIYRAMNKIGEFPDYMPVDTIGLVHVYGGGTYNLLGGQLSLAIPTGAMSDGTFFMVNKHDAQLSLSDGSVGQVFEIGSRSISLNKPITLRIATSSPGSLYYYNRGTWEPVESYMNPDNSGLTAVVDRMGTYLLGKPGASSQTAKFTMWAPSVLRPGVVNLYLALPQSAKVSWKVYDAAGKMVAQPYSGTLESGNRVLSWNADQAPEGVYFYQIRINGQTHLMKVALVGR